MKVCLLSDGIPGHVNQAHGLLDWLRAEGIALEVDIYQCRLRAKWLRPLLAAACNRLSHHRLLARAVLRCYHFSPTPAAADLILSAGGNTSFASAALAHLQGVPNIFIGSPRKLSASTVSALLTLEPSAGFERNNVVLDIAPARVSSKAPDQRTWALLLGGDGSGYEYRQQDWKDILRWANAQARASGIRWIVAGSRRSPAYLRDLCEEELDTDLVGAWCWPDSAQALSDLLPTAVRIVCTEDSMSMLCESMNLARPLLSLRPASAQPPARYRKAIAKFEQLGFLEREEARRLEKYDWQQAHTSDIGHRVSRARRRAIQQMAELIPALKKAVAPAPADKPPR
ncbi:ELM1/GtrOC1 family putative glycosyltransferase [Microbulbifer mangrovi]|uniref:ELM1/GtrOC1 family putative glycosyltransferase n=1 Tax=Microbulbifer mangrovi TaxID=927787 RepID=UPI00099064D9|nr:ELM1/GtrOC1 family putative glycosyltransferase [Microbulbifer mangrovi]